MNRRTGPPSRCSIGPDYNRADRCGGSSGYTSIWRYHAALPGPREGRGRIEGDSLMRNLSPRRYAVIACALGIIALVGGCKKNVPSSRHGEEAPPPSAAQPTVTLKASTVQIKPGDSVTLSWTSTDATDLSLAPGIGKVAAEGSVPVTPTQSTTYTITASGPGGTASASANITVGGAEEAPGPQASAGLDQLFQANVKDAF